MYSLLGPLLHTEKVRRNARDLVTPPLRFTIHGCDLIYLNSFVDFPVYCVRMVLHHSKFKFRRLQPLTVDQLQMLDHVTSTIKFYNVLLCTFCQSTVCLPCVQTFVFRPKIRFKLNFTQGTSAGVDYTFNIALSWTLGIRVATNGAPSPLTSIP